jgi:hypothetical protein
VHCTVCNIQSGAAPREEGLVDEVTNHGCRSQVPVLRESMSLETSLHDQ